MTTRALTYFGAWDVRLVERRDGGQLAPGEVLVNVRATGICGTDIGIVSGHYAARPGVVIGHESAGEVLRVGERVTSVRAGDRVVIDPTYHCGLCRMCRSARPNHCEEKVSRESGVSCDGTFATYYRTDERFVHTIAEHVSFAEASLTEPLSCTLTGLRQLRLRADMETVIVGGGPMGMLYCYALAANGFVGVIEELSARRRSLDESLLPQGWSIQPPDATTTAPVDLVIDTSGHALSRMLGRLRRGGQVLLVGLTGPDCSVSPAQLADRSISISGSIDSIDTFALAKRMIETGAIAARHLVTHHLPLDSYEEAFSLLGMNFAAQRRTPDDIAAIKIVLAP